MRTDVAPDRPVQGGGTGPGAPAGGGHEHRKGPWPFVTLRRYRHGGRPFVWRAREHRKGTKPAARGLDAAALPFWQRPFYNWLTGLLFAVGAFLFLAGSTMTLAPETFGGASTMAINVVFFLGSIPFTTAGYLQHFQAANAPAFHPDPAVASTAAAAATRRRGRVALIGWHPHSPGWISTFTQFVGTVAFNFNTGDALLAPEGWLVRELAIWGPDLVGSGLFLVSGYLAYIEAGHAYWSIRPRDLDWWIVTINLLGCAAFMASAVLAFIPSGPEPLWITAASTATLWLGALCFLVGALLLMRESRLAMRWGR
ncbi:hypothetical protein [Acuticoccus sediminis]|uniref:hypothetical protein n=1 Tax=Acuticoccus sediminis TaxID=2184697 RepID=UPI00192E542E|nr:hypothetical protein [Acuticoccus sediminis]